MTIKLTFASREDALIGVLFINNSQNMRVIKNTEQTITAELNKLDVNEQLIIKFFARPTNVEIIN